MPFISVIITAHNRREFLLEAVNSALNQSLPRDEYEIIVVKNFEDEKIDKFLEEHNVKNVFTKEEPLGAKVVEGIKESKGEVISFLEDDDLWLPQKLQVVKEVFKDKSVVYFHNDFLNFKGSINLDLINKKVATLNSNGLLKLKISDIKNFTDPINTSSVSIRKYILINELDKIRKINAILDLLLYWMAYCYNGILVLYDKVLTLRRVHGSNFSMDRFSSYNEWLNNLTGWSKRVVDSSLIILDLFSSIECKILDEYKRKLISHIEASYLSAKVTYSRLPNVENELTLKELVKYLASQCSFRSILYGFLPFAPRKIKYAIKRWYKYHMSEILV